MSMKSEDKLLVTAIAVIALVIGCLVMNSCHERDLKQARQYHASRHTGWIEVRP